MLKQTSKVLAAILYTIRPSATLGACLLAVSAFNPQTKEWQEVIWLVVCAFTGSSFCFILNDIFDKEKDLLNNKKRPIATGELPLPIALIATIVFGVIFMASAAAFGKVVLILSVLFLGLATSYSFLNRVSGFPANVMVAVFVAGTQWGVYWIKADSILYFSSLFLFFISIPREMLLDWLDIEGDRASGKSSLAWTTSLKRFNQILGLMIVGASSSIFLLLYMEPLPMHSIVLFITSTLLFGISFIRFFRNASRKNVLHGVRFSHLSYAIFMVAMLTR